jgi:hypothetical protein
MTITDLPSEGHYCLNPECGADDDHVDVTRDEETGRVRVWCHKCRFVGVLGEGSR